MTEVQPPKTPDEKQRVGLGEDVADVQELPIMLAVTEFIEYAMLSKLAGASGGSGFADHLSVDVKTLDGQCDAADSCPLWFQVKVKFSSSARENTDIFSFIKGNAKSARVVIECSQKLEDKSHLYVETNQFGGGHFKVNTSGEFHITEHKEVEEDSKTKLLVRFRVFQSRSHLLKECQSVLQYLRKIRILNSDIELAFSVNVFGVVSTTDVGPVAPCTRVAQRRLVTNPKHFMKDFGFLQKLSFKSSGCFMVNSIKRDNCLVPDIKMFVISTAIPPPPALPIKCETCRKIQMSFYGPGGIPLVVPNVSFGDTNLSSLISMADYGAEAGHPITLEKNSSPDVIWPDYQFSLTPEGTLSETAADSSSSDTDTSLQNRKYVIHLIFILEKVNDHFTTEKYLNFLGLIRRNLQPLVTLRNKKIRRSVHTSLDKVLMNKKTLEEEILRNKILKKAIPTISNALCSVLTQSVNKNFREECFNLMKVTNSRAMKRVLHKNLWSIAAKVHGVVPCEATILPFEERVSQSQQPAEEEASQQSAVPRKRRKQQYLYDHGDVPCLSQNTTQATCTEVVPSASTVNPEHSDTLATIQPSPNLHIPEINFDALGTAFIRDEDSMFQDDMGGIEDIEMAEQILLEEVRKITEAPIAPAAEKLEATIDDSWFNDLIDDPEFLI